MHTYMYVHMPALSENNKTTITMVELILFAATYWEFLPMRIYSYLNLLGY